MRPLSRLSILMISALVSATPSLAQEVSDGGDDGERDGIDWSVGLRGSYAKNSLTGEQTSMALTPEVSLRLGGESKVTTRQHRGCR